MQYESCYFYYSVDAHQNILEISGGAVNIPLKDGKSINIPVDMLNISEEVSKTGIWKQMSAVDTNNGLKSVKRERCDVHYMHVSSTYRT